MKNRTTTTPPAEENALALPPKLAAALSRIEAEGCESSRQARQVATWDCSPDEADTVVAAWEAKRDKLARETVHELSRAGMGPDRDTTQTTMNTSTDTDPDFEFLGIPRRLWGPMTVAAYKAEANALAAETAHAAAENALAARREELARAEEDARAADEEARFSANRAKVAREKVANATSREDFDACKVDADKAEEAADAAAKRARELQQHAETVKHAPPTFTGEAERRRAAAVRFRNDADAAAKRATEGELPNIRKRIAEADAARRREREAAKLIDARRHLVRVTCRECRYWQPSDFDPMRGECHARPPVAKVGAADSPTVDAENWCGMGETIPPPEK